MSRTRRVAAAVLDSGPVLILAAIAGAGSFAHIRDTATQHGQHGPMSWAIAVCIDLTCVMAARERHRDKHTRPATRRISWPAIVLAGGVLLSLAANLDQAQPTTWGRITAATPAAAFLTAISMLNAAPPHHPPAGPPSRPVPAQDEDPAAVPPGPDNPALPSPASDGYPPGPLLDFARRVAAEHHAATGQPITRDALRARLGVSNKLASDLLRHLRTATPTEGQNP